MSFKACGTLLQHSYNIAHHGFTNVEKNSTDIIYDICLRIFPASLPENMVFDPFVIQLEGGPDSQQACPEKLKI
jgi:hypothetical protein